MLHASKIQHLGPSIFPTPYSLLPTPYSLLLPKIPINPNPNNQILGGVAGVFVG
jgi:hypothetical protein